MPGLDKTGPLGQGAQTGKKMGQCAQENNTIPEENPRRSGIGRGAGRRTGLNCGRNVPGDGLHFGRRKGRRK